MPGERALLRRVRKFIPPGATVLAVDVAMADPLGPVRSTPLVLTDQGLFAITSVRASTVVTAIPPDQVIGIQTFHGALFLSFLDADRQDDRLVRFDFRQHGERDGFINKVADVMAPSFERRHELKSKGWVQEWLPLSEEDPSACGMATISVFGSALVAVIEPGDHFFTQRQSRDRHIYPWGIFSAYFADGRSGVLYLKFSSGGLGIKLKPELFDEWVQELEAHGLPVDPGVVDEDWRVRFG